jgi:photosystem II stability/assembly factor-like uncharacterized protein
MMTRMRIAMLIALIAASAPPMLYGQVWKQVNDTLEYTINCFYENDGVLFAGSRLGLFRSTDFGVEWSSASFPWQNWVGLIERKGYLFAASSGIGMYRSSDNGLSWHSVRNGLEGNELASVSTTGDTLFVGTEGDGVFRSTNNGDSWLPAREGVEYIDFNCFLVHQGTLFAGTGDGVWRTTDNGDHWSRIKGMESQGVNCLALFNDILFVGSGRVYRWDNERDTMLSSELLGPITGIAEAYNKYIFAATGSSGVLVSRDTGATWEHINTGLTNRKTSTLARFNDKLFVTASDGGMWTLDLEVFLGVEGNDIAPRPTFPSPRITPNPASERATARYILDKPSSVRIMIYDALGRIVARPVDGVIQESGEHQVVVPTEGLASGVYLCSVEAGGVERATQFVIMR